jgi:hypothetical protein
MAIPPEPERQRRLLALRTGSFDEVPKLELFGQLSTRAANGTMRGRS